MSELFSRIKKSLEESLDTAKNNAQTFKEIAGDYSKTTRLKFELYQLQNKKKKKLELLGETVFPFLAENNTEGLQKHETLPILLDDVKYTNNEIELTQKSIEEISEKERPEIIKQEKEALKKKIKDVENEIETQMSDLNELKDTIDKN